MLLVCRSNFIALRRHLDVDLTPALEQQIASLRSHLSGVDWRRVFGRRPQADATSRENDADEFVVPPSPGNIKETAIINFLPR